MGRLLITMAAALLVSSGPTFAQNAQQTTQTTQKAQSAKPVDDSNQIVCERQEVIGSRIATQRICKTRAEWADQRRSERMDLEKQQTQRSTTNGR